MARLVRFVCVLLLTSGVALVGRAGAEVVRLPATADIWVSDANTAERNTSSGKNRRIKLKTIQEMAAIRFDPTPAAGREIHRATLHLRRSGDDMLRYIRISTVSQDWVEGNATEAYSPADGATYQFADGATQTPWAWPGSQFCDVIMGAGNTLAQWAERQEGADGWVSVQIAADMVYAMVAGDTDGIAIMDGGNPTFANNFLYSAQAGASAPYIEVELGDPLPVEVSAPTVAVEPALDASRVGLGALRVVLGDVPGVFAWRVWLDGERVQRWRIPHPRRGEPTMVVLDDLTPEVAHIVEAVAVGASGCVSARVAATAAASAGLPTPALLMPADAALLAPAPGGVRRSVWVFPSPRKLKAVDSSGEAADVARTRPRPASVRLFGARGEYVSFQIAVAANPVRDAMATAAPLMHDDGSAIATSEIELYRTWYARDGDDAWQTAYCVPAASGEPIQFEDARRTEALRSVEALYVDIYVPKDAAAGAHHGSISVRVNEAEAVEVSVEVDVYDFALPDRLSFWPELNAYRIPRDGDPHDYYRLAQAHRAVLNCWRWAPRLEGEGADVVVDWTEYDRDVGPLLTGVAFAGSRRGPVPVEVMYLPFEDSWPTPLTEETYDYHGYWPGRGDDRQHLIDHYQTAPYLADALSNDYIGAFLSVQQQFFVHFEEKGYASTAMQCFYGGKNTHRIDYGSNMWWTTDEPYHWDDWLALQFFCALWTGGRGATDAAMWPARADISRPQWQAGVLDGLVDTVYYGAGAFRSEANYRRVSILERDAGLKPMVYGSVNRDTESNTRTVAWMLNAWLNGANGVLPWQTLGNDAALDDGDDAIGGGAALLVPGGRFGVPVVADMRLKALRDGQQLIEYLTIVADSEGLTREQVKRMVESSLEVRATATSDAVDDADGTQGVDLAHADIQRLRRALAGRITGRLR
jgi:hypothetical protein